MNPNDRIALQASAGHLREADAGVATLPRQDVNLITASAIIQRPWRATGTFAATLAYGLKWGPSNIVTSVVTQTSHAALLEWSLSPSPPHTWFGRFEIVGKPAHDLHADEFSPVIFTVGKLQTGYVRHFRNAFGLRPGIGATISASLLPPLLAPRYDGRVAPGMGVFFVLEQGEPGAHGAHMHEMN